MIPKPISKSLCKPFINFDMIILLLQLFLAQPAMPKKLVNQKTGTKRVPSNTIKCTPWSAQKR
jgi:hypothetical protein